MTDKRSRSRDKREQKADDESQKKDRPQIKRGEAERREARTIRTAPRQRMLPPAAASGAARATDRPAYAGRPLRARSPLGVPPRFWPRFSGLSLDDSGPGFLGLGGMRALPALACPSPAEAPRAPVVVPADMMPGAARERFARPPAGTALAPHAGSHPDASPRGRAAVYVGILSAKSRGYSAEIPKGNNRLNLCYFMHRRDNRDAEAAI
jgi:hypothetical protein